MKIYIWHYLFDLTGNEHSGGGLIIVTDRDYNDAWADYLDSLGNRYGHIRTSIDESPDLSYEVDEDTERVIVHADSGCC